MIQIRDLFAAGILKEGYSVKHFNYTFQELNLAAGASANNQITILADSDFIVTTGYGMVLNQSTKADLPYHPVTCELSDPSEKMQNVELPFAHVFGHPERPVYWDGYAVLRANSTVILTLNNNHGSTAVDIYATLKGFKVWK